MPTQRVFPRQMSYILSIQLSHAASGRDKPTGIEVHLWVTDSRWGEEFKWTLNNRLERLSVLLLFMVLVKQKPAM